MTGAEYEAVLDMVRAVHHLERAFATSDRMLAKEQGARIYDALEVLTGPVRLASPADDDWWRRRNRLADAAYGTETVQAEVSGASPH